MGYEITSETSADNLMIKYEKCNRNIKANSMCYLIALEWWLNFEFFRDQARENSEFMAGSCSPIENLPLVELSEEYKKLIKPNENGPIDDSKLYELNDWNKMTLKPNLRYNQDFVVVSQKVWTLLNSACKGGPVIPVYAETANPASMVSLQNFIDRTECSDLDPGAFINMDLKRIYVSKSGDMQKRSCYVALTQTVHSVLRRFCDEFMFPPHKSIIQLKTGGANADSNGFTEINITDQTLAQAGIKENCFINVDQVEMVGSGNTHGTHESPNKNEAASHDYIKRRYDPVTNTMTLIDTRSGADVSPLSLINTPYSHLLGNTGTYPPRKSGENSPLIDNHNRENINNNANNNEESKQMAVNNNNNNSSNNNNNHSSHHASNRILTYNTTIRPVEEDYFRDTRGIINEDYSNANDSTETVSTALTKSESNSVHFDMFDREIFDDRMGMNNKESRIEISEIKNDKGATELAYLIEKAKMALHSEKIKLDNKPIKTLKANINQIYLEWCTNTKNKIVKKTQA
jgi:hypothetical protein